MAKGSSYRWRPIRLAPLMHDSNSILIRSQPDYRGKWQYLLWPVAMLDKVALARDDAESTLCRVCFEPVVPIAHRTPTEDTQWEIKHITARHCSLASLNNFSYSKDKVPNTILDSGLIDYGELDDLIIDRFRKIHQTPEFRELIQAPSLRHLVEYELLYEGNIGSKPLVIPGSDARTWQQHIIDLDQLSKTIPLNVKRIFRGTFDRRHESEQPVFKLGNGAPKNSMTFVLDVLDKESTLYRLRKECDDLCVLLHVLGTAKPCQDGLEVQISHPGQIVYSRFKAVYEP